MKAIYNRWRWDAESWMNPQALMKYKQLFDSGKNSAAQQLGKSAFSTYLFQLSGSKFLLHKLIQLPILPQCTIKQSPGSAEPPAALHPLGSVLMKCVADLQEHKETTRTKQQSSGQKSVPARRAARASRFGIVIESQSAVEACGGRTFLRYELGAAATGVRL